MLLSGGCDRNLRVQPQVDLALVQSHAALGSLDFVYAASAASTGDTTATRGRLLKAAGVDTTAAAATGGSGVVTAVPTVISR